MTSELDSAVSDRITDDIREFDVFLLVPQVLEDYVNTTRVNVRDDVEACVRARDVDESYAAGREATANVRVSEVDASQYIFRACISAAYGQMSTAISYLLDIKMLLLLRCSNSIILSSPNLLSAISGCQSFNRHYRKCK